ncbi:MAG: histidine phosphatase family protein [Pseudomonadota bacterium]
MAELMVIRHGQASFGAANYDVLSDLGHAQSRAVGAHLADTGWTPDRIVIGTMQRHAETLASMGFDGADSHSGFNEYDFADLLAARYEGEIPELVKGDRKTHFRTLRDTVLMWQRGELAGVAETWDDFAARTEAARAFACDTKAKRVLVVSSGGVIGQLASRALEAPTRMMMELNLQVKNTSVTTFVFSGPRFFLHQFNAAPHLDAAPDLLSYS